MKLLVKLEINDLNEDNLKYQFMSLLVNDIRTRLLNNLKQVNTIKVQKAVLSSNILWKIRKPKTINSIVLLKEIIGNIKWIQLNETTFLIEIDRNKKLNKTNTSLESVAKIIDYGSTMTLPIRFFSNIFNDFYKESKSYWRSYKQYKIKIKVKELTLIR